MKKGKCKKLTKKERIAGIVGSGMNVDATLLGMGIIPRWMKKRKRIFIETFISQ